MLSTSTFLTSAYDRWGSSYLPGGELFPPKAELAGGGSIGFASLNKYLPSETLIQGMSSKSPVSLLCESEWEGKGCCVNWVWLRLTRSGQAAIHQHGPDSRNNYYLGRQVSHLSQRIEPTNSHM